VKEVVGSYSKLLFQHLSEDTEEKHKIFHRDTRPLNGEKTGNFPNKLQKRCIYLFLFYLTGLTIFQRIQRQAIG
jgi:hypothetical protein